MVLTNPNIKKNHNSNLKLFGLNSHILVRRYFTPIKHVNSLLHITECFLWTHFAYKMEFLGLCDSQNLVTFGASFSFKCVCGGGGPSKKKTNNYLQVCGQTDSLS